MTGRLIALVLAASLCWVTTPAFAGQRDCKAPPGTSGIDQYCETIPGAGGDRGAADRSGRRTESTLSRGTADVLRHAGPNGAAILALPTGAPRHPPPSSHPPPAAPTSESPLNAVGAAVESGASLGSIFIWVIVGLGLALAATAWLRYRRLDQG
jgi:hypothetical protein